jgi:ABC-type oligopeptide transport system ATPase subunit
MSEMTDAYVKLDKVSKIYGTKEVKIVAVDEISFEIAKGEFVVIVGPSGAGKTTVLNILGGMDQATSGEVLVDGRNIARYMRLDRLIPEFKDAVDKGTLAMVAAVDLSYLNVKMQKMIQQVAEAEGKKLKPKQAVELRKMGKDITKEGIESVLAGKEQKKSQSVSVKLPVELYERYFGQMDAGAVQEIMEKALEGYFGKEAPGV